MTGRAALSLLLALAASGCVFQDVREQQAGIDAYCVLSGTLAAANEVQGPFIVTLARAHVAGPPAWQGIDHFVLERPGRWGFIAPAGAYRVAAFEDVNRDFLYQAGEPFIAPERSAAIACPVGGRFTDLVLRMPDRSEGRLDATLDLSTLTPRDSESQVNATLGQLTEAGRITTLADPRFSDDIARSAGVLLHGRNDLGSPVGPAWELAQAWPNSELTVVDDSGHTGSDTMRDLALQATARFGARR